MRILVNRHGRANARPTRTDENGVHLDRLEIMEVDP
jgi:hypothetical protein